MGHSTVRGRQGRQVVDLNTEIAVLDKQLRELVAAAAPRTMALFAVSTQHAAQLLITAGGNPRRLHSEAAFAALCANATLHMIAVLRLRWDPATKAYLARRTKDGLSKREIIRCLKRYIARQAYHAITADLAERRPR